MSDATRETASPAETSLLSTELMAQLERMELYSRKIFRGRMKGERRSNRKGQSVEYADFREYAPGDDLRFVDWNTYARLDRLFLKMYLEEEDLRLFILVDTSASMDFGTPTKLQFARQLAAALAFIGMVRSDRVKIETLNQPPAAPGQVFRGRASLWKMLAYLNSVEPGEGIDLKTGVRNFCLRNPGRGIAVLISDLLDKGGFEGGLRYLLSSQMDAYVIQVLAEDELKPAVHGDLRLVDVEDNDAAEITASTYLFERYRRNLDAFVNSIRDFCGKRGMTHILTSSQVPVEQLISNYLRKRGMVR